MKKFTFLFLISSVFLFSQNKTLKGIGIFQINETNISVLDSLRSNGFLQESCRTNYDCVRNTAGSKYILLPREDQTEKPLIDEHKTVWVSHYLVADIDISDMKLDFYNDKLYSIKIDGEVGLLDALKSKYFYVDSKKYNYVNCTSIFGTVKKEGWVFTTNFTKEKNIKALDHSEKYYNDSCEENYLSYLLIYDVNIENIVKSKEEKVRIELDKQDKENFKNKYKDL